MFQLVLFWVNWLQGTRRCLWELVVSISALPFLVCVWILYPRHTQRRGLLGGPPTDWTLNPALFQRPISHILPSVPDGELKRAHQERLRLLLFYILAVHLSESSPFLLISSDWYWVGALIFFPEKVHWQTMTRQVGRESITPRKLFPRISPV